MYLEVQFECIANLSFVSSSEEQEVSKQSLVNMGANISKVWSNTDSLLSPELVEKAVREGILNKNVPVTESYVEEESYVDDFMIVNNEDIVMTSLNSPRQENAAGTIHGNVQYEMLNDSADQGDDSYSDDQDDITDDIDTGFTYREILIITLSSSILIIIALIIAVLSYVHRRHSKSLPSHQPDLIPMSGSASASNTSNTSAESQYAVSNSPDTDNVTNDHITDFNNKFR